MTQPTQRKQHGGARPGSGPKRRDPDSLRQMMGFRMPPDVHEFLRSRDDMTEAVVTAIRDWSEYRNWAG